jgi:hypothetical protein
VGGTGRGGGGARGGREELVGGAARRRRRVLRRTGSRVPSTVGGGGAGVPARRRSRPSFSLSHLSLSFSLPPRPPHTVPATVTAKTSSAPPPPPTSPHPTCSNPPLYSIPLPFHHPTFLTPLASTTLLPPSTPLHV